MPPAYRTNRVVRVLVCAHCTLQWAWLDASNPTYCPHCGARVLVKVVRKFVATVPVAI